MRTSGLTWPHRNCERDTFGLSNHAIHPHQPHTGETWTKSRRMVWKLDITGQNTDAFRVLLLFSGDWEQNIQHSKCLHNRKSGKWIRWKSDSQCFASQTPCCCLPAGIELPRYGHLTLAHLAMDPGTGGINAAATVQGAISGRHKNICKWFQMYYNIHSFLRKLTNLTCCLLNDIRKRASWKQPLQQMTSANHKNSTGLPCEPYATLNLLEPPGSFRSTLNVLNLTTSH
jgi:hypothetical protein